MYIQVQQNDQLNHVYVNIHYMLLDVLELRSRRWQTRQAVAQPSTIAQVHADAARDQVAKEKESMQRIQASGTMSRGGSRRGGERTEFGPDGWSVAGGSASSRPPQTKAGDLSKFGTFSKPVLPTATFGPSKAFSKRDGKVVDTPVLSRQASSANMYSALNSEAAAENPPTSSSSRAPSRKPSLDLGPGGVPETTGRKKIILQPRTVPQESEETAVEASTVVGAEVATEKKTPVVAMTTAQADARIEEDVKEFWSLRDVDEAQHYFEALPAEHQSRLVSKLVTTAMDKKEVDVILTASVFAKAADARICSEEGFEEGLLPMVEIVDDLSIDVPKAYSFVARLLRGCKLPQSTIDSLVSKIPVDGSRQKLLKEYDQLK